MMRLFVPFTTMALAAALIAAPASARPELLSSVPAADATIAPTDHIEIRFSGQIDARSAEATLEMTDMPGMTMRAPMRMKLATGIATDGTTLIATTPRPLPRGGYRISYRIMTTDAQHVEGEFGFKVR